MYSFWLLCLCWYIIYFLLLCHPACSEAILNKSHPKWTWHPKKLHAFPCFIEDQKSPISGDLTIGPFKMFPGPWIAQVNLPCSMQVGPFLTLICIACCNVSMLKLKAYVKVFVPRIMMKTQKIWNGFFKGQQKIMQPEKTEIPVAAVASRWFMDKNRLENWCQTCTSW